MSNFRSHEQAASHSPRWVVLSCITCRRHWDGQSPRGTWSPAVCEDRAWMDPGSLRCRVWEAGCAAAAALAPRSHRQAGLLWRQASENSWGLRAHGLCHLPPKVRHEAPSVRGAPSIIAYASPKEVNVLVGVFQGRSRESGLSQDGRWNRDFTGRLGWWVARTHQRTWRKQDL